jgi:hypothetical protein
MTTKDDSKLYDVRTLERRLRKGVLSKKEYDKHLKSLPDRSDNIATAEPDPNEPGPSGR